tara:strand:+ start:43742 stop:44038 length:297 start_codon:yes stop_codon:yes gene_type:complete
MPLSFIELFVEVLDKPIEVCYSIDTLWWLFGFQLFNERMASPYELFPERVKLLREEVNEWRIKEDMVQENDFHAGFSVQLIEFLGFLSRYFCCLVWFL